MLICQLRHHTTTRGTLDKALHDEERLIDLLDSTCIFTNSSGNCRDSNGTTTELINDGEQDAVVYLVKTILVDIQRLQGNLGDAGVDATSALNLCIIDFSPS